MAGKGEAASEIFQKFGQGVSKGIDTLLESNKAIFSNATDDAVKNSRGILGTIARTRNGLKEGDKIILEKGDVAGAAKSAFSKGGDPSKGYDWGTIAGSALGVSAGYRVLSGGGLYKDKNGNTNIIGIPFV
jgi:hypothetical protein